MAIHPKDKLADNPRLQCSACHKWMRLHGRDKKTGDMFYRFYGGCAYTNGDHLAGKPNADGCHEVCDGCCQMECKRLSEA